MWGASHVELRKGRQTIKIHCPKYVLQSCFRLCGHTSIDAEIMSGMPVFAGTRVPIQNLFENIEGRDDLTEFLYDFPSVSKQAAVAGLERAKKR